MVEETDPLAAVQPELRAVPSRQNSQDIHDLLPSSAAPQTQGGQPVAQLAQEGAPGAWGRSAEHSASSTSSLPDVADLV